MPDQGNKDSVEREQTDGALRTEREKTDRALAERQQAIEGDADEVIERARENADAVLETARDKADQRLGLEEVVPPVAARAVIADEREQEDAAVREERESADESLRRERLETARALRALLPLERQKTDRHLLTERVRWDEALSNRDDFLGIVSHDLRGLLGGIVMSAGLLAAKAPDNSDGKYALLQAERIQRYAARMNRLIGDLVDVASIEAGKLAVVPVSADAALLLAEAMDTFEAPASARSIALTLELDQQPLMAAFDYPRMLQVLTNLVSNAMKFTADAGRIVLRGEAVDGEVRLSVSDTGVGIPAHQLEAVFERFWQVHATDRRGLGLGLYISRCILDAHDGRIWAESTEGAGTTIYITLPGAG